MREIMPGSWGRRMNGGAWLEIGGERIDVVLRDLTVAEHWTARPSAASSRWTRC